MLLEGSKCTWLDPRDGSCREGTWEVGTYTRQGDVNRDVNVIFSNAGNKTASKSLNSEWSAYEHVKIVLHEDGKTCQVVDQFKFENLKRCSGHNTLLEGEVRPMQPKLKRKEMRIRSRGMLLLTSKRVETSFLRFYFNQVLLLFKRRSFCSAVKN